jgi:hypothetical protein
MAGLWLDATPIRPPEPGVDDFVVVGLEWWGSVPEIPGWTPEFVSAHHGAERPWAALGSPLRSGGGEMAGCQPAEPRQAGRRLS